jgi:hypothetical protein
VTVDGARANRRELATYDGRSVCPGCGARLVCLDDDVVEIRIGSLDDAPFELEPEAEIWIKRREPWLHAVAGASSTERAGADYLPLRSISSTRY